MAIGKHLEHSQWSFNASVCQYSGISLGFKSKLQDGQNLGQKFANRFFFAGLFPTNDRKWQKNENSYV